MGQKRIGHSEGRRPRKCFRKSGGIFNAKDKDLNVTEISVYGECTENPDIFVTSYY